VLFQSEGCGGSSVPSVVFGGSEKSRFVGDDRDEDAELEMDRVTVSAGSRSYNHSESLLCSPCMTSSVTCDTLRCYTSRVLILLSMSVLLPQVIDSRTSCNLLGSHVACVRAQLQAADGARWSQLLKT